MQTVKLFAGMTGEYEIIKTNAPKELIEKQLRHYIELQEKNEVIDNPYELLEQNGFAVVVIGCQDDFDETEINIDMELDCYTY